MRTLSRNKQAVYYATYGKTEDTTDEYGNIIGAKTTYSEVRRFMANVSPAKGDAELQQFGINEDYTRTIVTTEKKSQKPLDLVFEARFTILSDLRKGRMTK